MSLFKYCTISKNTFILLASNKIYFSKPSQFNDPFDSQILGKEFIEGLVKVDVISQSDDLALWFNELDQELKPRLEETGILCLSRRPNSILMWSHYAGEHTGIRLEFCDDLCSKIQSGVPLRQDAIEYLTDELTHPYFKVFCDIADNVYSSENGLLDEKAKQAVIESAFLSKHPDWRYEEEVRIRSDKNGPIEFEPEALISVAFGMRTPKEDRNAISTLLSLDKWKHVKLFDAKPVNHVLGLEDIPIS